MVATNNNTAFGFDYSLPFLSSDFFHTTIPNLLEHNLPSYFERWDRQSIMGMLLFVLLSLQCGAHPILVKLFLPTTVVRSTIIFSQEVVKLVMSLLFLTCNGTLLHVLHSWSFPAAVLAAGIPSVLFVVQGYCNLMACQVLPPVTYVLLNQTKIISTALCCYIWLGQTQSPLQIIALVLLVIATMLLQKIIPTEKCLYGCDYENSYSHDEQDMKEPLFREDPQQKPLLAIEEESSSLSFLDEGQSDALENQATQDIGNTLNPPTDGRDDDDDNDFDARKVLFMGVLPALLASFISGLAGTLTQRTLQAQGRDPYLFNIELSTFSILFILFSLMSPSTSSDSNSTIQIGSPDFHRIRKEGLIVGWTWHTLVPIVSSAVGGVLVGLITKYSGAVVKGFAIIFGIIVSAMLNQLVLKDGEGRGGLTREEILGASVGILSLWIHLTNPPAA
jgi:UDP-sugar transporter A1/2/3